MGATGHLVTESPAETAPASIRAEYYLVTQPLLTTLDGVPVPAIDMLLVWVNSKNTQRERFDFKGGNHRLASRIDWYR